MKSFKHRRLIQGCVFVMIGLFCLSACAPDVKQLTKEKDVEGLIKVLDSEDEELRHDAIEALGDLGDSRAVEPLIEWLEKENSGYLFSVIEALGKIKDPRAVEPLIEIMTIKHVRSNAAQALAEIGDSRAIVPLISYMGLSADIYEIEAIHDAILKFDEAAVLPLIDALKDEDTWLASRAAELLGEIKDERAILPLVEVLDVYSVKDAAGWSLKEFGEAAVDPLIHALMVDHIDYAYYPLILIGSPGTESELIEALDYFGMSHMAEDYLNSGNDLLEDAAQKWASGHGYMITKLPGWGGPFWRVQP